jgi:hypothetical protein
MRLNKPDHEMVQWTEGLARRMPMLSKTKRSSALDGHTRTKRPRAYLHTFALALGCMTIAAPAIARTPYDGDWSVVIATRGGACPASVRYGVQIINGTVVNPSGQAQVQGRVSPNGAVRVTVQAGGQWASGSGHLSRTRGGGVWRGQGNAGSCQGTWVAERSARYGAEVRGPSGPIYSYEPPAYRHAPPTYRYVPRY